MREAPVLIAGAGPTGLSAALFLSHLGVASRIVDPKPQPSQTSNALGVNPRTLDLLEPTGVTARILEEGFVLRRLAAHQEGRLLAEVRLEPEALGARHPMVILPQWRTEALLTEALAARGIAPERELTLEGLQQEAQGVSFTLSRAGRGRETGRCQVLLAADGAHSAVRHALGLGFDGSAFPEAWSVADVEMTIPQEPHGYLDFRREGLFLALPYSATHWRLIGFGGEVKRSLPAGWELKQVKWRSEFHISHRLASQLSVGRTCLAGDAAHIHAPVGARGMNLGIEDAYVFAHLAAEALASGDEARLADYGRLRRAADGAVVRRVEAITKLARARGGLARLIRPLVFPMLVASPAVRRAMTAAATGLDHPVRLS